jgi:uroporphyrin-III C-methyltransferase
MSATASGKVYLVGAGPGDPKLLTLRAVEVLGACDVVLVDRLVSRDILVHLRPGADVIDVGKRAGNHLVKQADICAFLVAHAKEGKVVVRLKGGDPFVYGRGGEEALALVEAGIAWEVVPGVSAGVAAAAYAGIPLTHRGVASSVSFRTAHYADPDRDPEAESDDETVVLFMCGSTIASAARELIAAGRAPSTPIAVIHAGTTSEQEVLIGTLEDALHGPLQIPSPALTIVGSVVNLEARLRWFGARASRPLRAESHEAPHERRREEQDRERSEEDEAPEPRSRAPRPHCLH